MLPAGSRLLVRLGSLLDQFDEEPFLLPISDPPAGVPRLVLRDADGSKVLALTSESATLVKKLTVDNAPTAPTPSELIEFVRLTEVPARRVGAVRRSFIATETPSQFLTSRFTTDEANQGPFRRSEEFQIHNFKRFRPDAWSHGDLNSWVRLSVASVTANESTRQGVVILQDLNTVAGESDVDLDLAEFAAMAEREMETILAVYFPNDEIEWSEQWQ